VQGKGAAVFYDRTVSSQLLDALDAGGVLHGLVTRVLENPALLDLQLRGYPRRAECWASVYLGLTSILNVYAHPARGFRFTTHSTHAIQGFNPAWRAWHSSAAVMELFEAIDGYLDAVMQTIDPHHVRLEGKIHTLLCSRALSGFAVIDREAAVCFEHNAERQAVLMRVADPYRRAIASTRTGDAWRSVNLALGTGCDLLAMDDRGRLLVVEVKPASSTAGITWAPAQVGVYAELFREWIQQDALAAARVLQNMLRQRVHLGLSPDLHGALQDPVEIVPVVVVGGTVRSKLALGRLAEVQRTLRFARVGWPTIERWDVDEQGRLDAVAVVGQ
jgi:hypothetical protein